jgi:O-antigen/teichoic acid export membrane protein
MPSLVRNAGWSLTGAASYNASQWLTLVAVARLADVELAGSYVLAVAIVGPVFLLANLQLGGLLATDASWRFPVRTYRALRACGLAAALVVIGIGAQRSNGDTAMLVALLAVARTLDSAAELESSRLQRAQVLRFPAEGLMINGTLTLALSVIALLQRSTAAALGVASMAGSAVALAYVAFRAATLPDARLNRSRHDFGSWQALLAQALPLGFIGALLSLTNGVPAYFLAMHGGKQSVAVFGAIAYPLLALTMITGAVAQAGSPQLATAYARANAEDFSRVLRAMIFVGCAVAVIAIVGGLLLGEPLLRFAYGAEYAAAHEAFTILCIAFGARFVFVYVGIALTVVRMLRVQVVIRVVGLAGLLAASSLLVPTFGVKGATLAVLGATLLEGIMWLHSLRTVVRETAIRFVAANVCAASSAP